MRSRIGSFFWLGIGVFTTIGAIRLGVGEVRQPGPGFIFLLAALLLAILSIADLMIPWIGKAKEGGDGGPTWVNVRWPKVLLVLAGMCIYQLLFKPLGFFVATLLLMIFLFKAVEPTKWWAALLGSLATILSAFGIFKLWLKVPFPSGIFGF